MAYLYESPKIMTTNETINDNTNVIKLQYINEQGQLIATEVLHLDLLNKMNSSMRTLVVEQKIKSLCGLSFDPQDLPTYYKSIKQQKEQNA